MIVFLIAAALLSAATVALVTFFAGREPQTAGSDPAAAVYRRQLGEIDDMADRGLLAEDERRAARTEAARRLLGAGETVAEVGVTKGVRLSILAGAVGAALLAIGIYFVVGAPGQPDQPFKRRAEAWTKDFDTNEGRNLDAESGIVVLKEKLKERPDDPRILYGLAVTQLRVGQTQSGIHNLKRLAELAPGEPQVWQELGQALVQATPDQSVPPEAVAAFKKALALDPKAAGARFFLAQAKVEAGDKAGGVADLKALAADVPQDGAKLIQERIDQIEGRSAPVKLAEGDPQSQMIKGMVESLAAKLKENPNDAAGWARLIRSYAVLGETDKMNAALEQARRIFKDKPSERAAIEAAADKPQ